MKHPQINQEYNNWIKKIAHEKSLDSLIKHFREHVGAHYEKYDRSKPLNRDVWLVDVLNFMNILKEKKLKITEEDMLFKLALHYRNHKDGPKPDFDVNEFIKSYQGRYKKFDMLSSKNKATHKNKLG